jgi:hypothetical protein
VKKNIDFGDIGAVGGIGTGANPRPSLDDMEALLSGGLLGDEQRLPFAATGSEGAAQSGGAAPAGGAASAGQSSTATVAAGDDDDE